MIVCSHTVSPLLQSLVEVIALTFKSGDGLNFGGYEAGEFASGQHYSPQFKLCQWNRSCGAFDRHSGWQH